MVSGSYRIYADDLSAIPKFSYHVTKTDSNGFPQITLDDVDPKRFVTLQIIQVSIQHFYKFISQNFNKTTSFFITNLNYICE